jgi:hypothetical protein
MKPGTAMLFAFLIILSSSCSGPDMFVICPDGSQHLRVTPVMLGGKRTVMYRHDSPDGGTTRISIMHNLERSFDSAVAALAAGVAAVGTEYFNTKDAENILNAAVDRDKVAAGVTVAAQQAALKEAALQASLQKAAIREGITILPR